MSEPTTEAGKAFLGEFGGQEFHDDTPPSARQSWLDLQAQVTAKIIAIEQEARANADRELRDAVLSAMAELSAPNPNVADAYLTLSLAFDPERKS
jgi:hypothetical protein